MKDDRAANPMTRAHLAAELGTLLEGLASVYTSLIEQSEVQRDAVRKADGAGVEQAARVQEHLVERLASLEQARRELVARSCTAFPGVAGKRPTAITLTDLARCADPDQAPRLAARAQAVRDLITRHSRSSAVVLGATRSLLDHAEGLLRQVARELSHAGTYTRRGVVEPAGTVVSALDLRT